MSRIRTIKPELLEDAVAAGLSDTAFRLFVSMILLADDFGILRAETSLLSHRIWWSRVPGIPVPAAIQELEPLVQFYEVKGQRYAHIRGWKKHQKVDRPGNQRLPSPPPELDSRESREGNYDDIESDNDTRESLATDLGPRTIGPRNMDQDQDQSAPEARGSSPDLNSVFDSYLDSREKHLGTTPGAPPVFTPKRQKLVKDKVKAGYSFESLCLAASGIFLSDWHLTNKTLDFEYTMRESNIDKFIELAAKDAERRAKSVPSPRADPEESQVRPMSDTERVAAADSLLADLDVLAAQTRAEEEELWGPGGMAAQANGP